MLDPRIRIKLPHVVSFWKSRSYVIWDQAVKAVVSSLRLTK